MTVFKNTFLYKVYKVDKRLFFFLTSFFLLTLFANILGDEVTPFFVFGMYSEKEKEQRTYEVLKVIINDSIDLAKSDDAYYNNPLVKASLFYYISIKQNGGVDPTISFLKSKLKQHYSIIQCIERRVFNDQKDIEAFIPWYTNYMEQIIRKPVNSVWAGKHYVRYNSFGTVVVDSTKAFLEWKKS